MTDIKTPVKSAGTNGAIKKERKPRTKKTTDLKSVGESAALLSFEDKITLVKDLKLLITQEAQNRATAAAKANELTQGL